MSRRQDIITELKTRLASITVDNGYQTDAGENVYVGQVPALNDGDPDQAIAMVVEDDEPGYSGEHTVIRLPIEIRAVVRVNVDDPYAMTEAVIADIKRAIERTTEGVKDHNLGGLLTPRGLERRSTTAAFRDQGSEFGAGVVRYACLYNELWGEP